MPIKRIEDKTVPTWLIGGDMQTIYPQLFRWPSTNYHRERIDTPDDDFLDLDWIKTGSDQLVIVNHGLEGDSNGRYIKGISNYMSKKGFDVLAWNYRGRSGEPNKQVYSYHAGFTRDLEFIAEKYAAEYRAVFMVGFSLGGCVTLNYLGRLAHKIPKEIKAAVAISTPLHLSSCSSVLDTMRNYGYRQYFLRKLDKSVSAKAAVMPDQVQYEPMKTIRTIRDFDENYTAPINGFDNAESYYQHGSPIHQLKSIEIPVLILNARNDPFLSAESFPSAIPNLPEHVHYHISKDGGHVGFSGTGDNGAYFSERYAYQFIKQFSS